VFLYCNYGTVPTKVYCDFWEGWSYFVVDELILLFVALIELLGLGMLLYCLWVFGFLWVACRTWVGRIGHYRCFLHRQITGFTRSCDSSSELVSWTDEHTRVYLDLGPSVEVIALRPVSWYWVKTCVTRGEQSARMVHMLKGVWISCLLPDGQESFYRQS
jgi:hypothetical protein